MLFIPIIVICLLCLIIFIFQNINKPKKKHTYRLHALSNYLSSEAKHELYDRERLFINHKYKIQGKPDDIIFDKNKYYLVEYKNRFNGIYEGDIKQAIATLLSCRSSKKYENMSDILIYNKSGQVKHLKLDLSDQELFMKIKNEYNQALDIKNNKPIQVYKNIRKCNSCGFQNTCNINNISQQTHK
jgi:CRISPR/Cas system-associated exonuclease Cas4 (RecB family)